MGGASDSGERKAVNVDSILKTIGAAILACAIGIGGFALKEAYSLRIDHESLKAQYQSSTQNDKQQMQEMKEWMRNISTKLDRLVEGRSATLNK